MQKQGEMGQKKYKKRRERHTGWKRERYGKGERRE